MSILKDSAFKIQQISETKNSIRLPDELIARMEWIAVKNRIALDDLIKQCCNYALEHMEDKP